MKLDEIDFKILSLLEKDPRISHRKIARKINSSTPTVSSKIKALEHLGIIKKYSIELDFKKIGNYKDVLIIECDPKKTKALEEKLSTLDNVRKIFKLESNAIMITFVYKNIEELHKLLDLLAENAVYYKRYSILSEEKSESDYLLDKDNPLKIKCYYCKGDIKGDPVIAKVRGENKYFCCNVCKSEYLKKIERLTAL